jgi:1-acyl-sn-glycerol-3-phosphate acyltransferase
MTTTDTFADIRPFNDDEVRPVLDRLLADSEFIDAVAALKFSPLIRPLVKPVLRWVLGRQFKKVHSVTDFQHVVKGYMDGMLESRTTKFTVSGLEQLDPKQSYLFVSNHRDIAMDPAFLNYAMYRNGFETVRIAIGDNLLSKAFVSDLMRLNKSFIVNRSAKGPREMLAASKHLASYIRHSIQEEGCSVWIAQREGRAKDGNDKTEPAIIKMFSLAQKRKQESFADFIRGLNIVPVAISYELDPCDGAKAKELYEKENQGSYQKSEHEDVISIAKGIDGQKGHVHVSFGTPLSADFDNADQVAEAVDQQVWRNYVLHSSNFFAYKRLHGAYPHGVYSDQQIAFDANKLQDEEQAFNARIDEMPAAHRDYALGIYANAIKNN